MAKIKHLCVLPLLIVLAGCMHSNSNPSTWKPGQVLDQRSESLGHGYRRVSRSVVNGPGHWEGIGHFSYVYFRRDQLCRCSPSEVAIESGGRYAVYVDSDTKALMLFNSSARERIMLSEEYLGLPTSGTWDLDSGTVLLTLRRWVDSGKHVDEQRSFSLPNRP